MCEQSRLTVTLDPFEWIFKNNFILCLEGKLSSVYGKDKKTGVGLKLSFLIPGNSDLAMHVSKTIQKQSLQLHLPSFAYLFH